MRLRSSLRTKLALLITAVVACLSLIFFLYLNARIREDAVQSAREEGTRIAEVAAFTVSPALLFDDPRSAAEALSPACRSSIVATVQVVNVTGRMFYSCRGAGDTSHGVLVARVPVLNQRQSIGQVRLDVSLAPASLRIAASRRWLVGVSLIVFGVGVAAAFAISLLVTRPLASIAETLEGVRAGDLTRRATVVSRDEVGALANTFNLMLDELVTSRSALEELNRGLELTVERRSREVTMLLQSTYDGIIATDRNGRCVMMNRSAATTLGRQAITTIGLDLHMLLHEHCDASTCGLPSLVSGADRRHARETFSRADGSLISVDVSIAPLQDGDTITGTVMTFRDVTERDELQRQLDHATRLSGLGTLAAKMAHEFNNVLMGILPFIEMIRRASAHDQKMANWCSTIIQSVTRGKRITQEVLRFTRPQRPNRRSLAVAPWLTEFSASLRVTAGDVVFLDVADMEPDLHVYADREQLEQVLVNLVSNSRDAMPSGGRVAISVSSEGDGARVRVRDDGPGMPQETLSRVFEPFFTTKSLGGTGLGLPIAEQIVKAHGGSIAIESSPGEGTTFEFELPLAVNRLTGGSGTSAESLLSISARVLLVEDDAGVASGLKTVLEEHGITVETASTGHAASAQIANSVPDAVILDIGLPDIDGITLYRTISLLHPQLPVVFSTGHGDETEILDLLNRPSVRFLQKPYPMESLLRALTEVIPIASAEELAAG